MQNGCVKGIQIRENIGSGRLLSSGNLNKM